MKKNEKIEKLSVKMEIKIQAKGRKKLRFACFGVKYGRIAKKPPVLEDESHFVKPKICAIIFVENVHFNFEWKVLL